MKALDGLVGGRRIGRKGLIVVGLVVLVALAGCSGLSGGDGTATPADGATPTVSETPDSDAIVEQTASAMATVDTYRMNATWNTTISAPNGQRTTAATVNTSIDRATDRIQVEQTAAALGRTITSKTYLVDGVIYQHSPQLTQQYGSEWVKIDASGNVTQQFHRNDELMSHRAMLENASVTVNGTETVEGGEAYRLELDVNKTAIETFYGYQNTAINITELTTTVWVDTESNRIVRADGVMNQTTTVAGQTATTSIDYDERFEYVDVTIELPEAADSAVPINQTSE